MDTTTLRLIAISLVMQFKPVLTNDQFVNMMSRAARYNEPTKREIEEPTSISDQKDNDGGKDKILVYLVNGVYGIDYDDLIHKHEIYILKTEILTTDTVPGMMRVWFTENANWERDIMEVRQDWDALKKELTKF